MKGIAFIQDKERVCNRLYDIFTKKHIKYPFLLIGLVVAITSTYRMILYVYDFLNALCWWTDIVVLLHILQWWNCLLLIIIIIWWMDGWMEFTVDHWLLFYCNNVIQYAISLTRSRHYILCLISLHSFTLSHPMG